MSTTRPQALEDHISKAWPVRAWRDSHVVLAVSSGPDSVALLRAVLSLKGCCGGSGEIIVAHFNHAVRALQADADQAWLASLCSRLGVTLKVGRFAGSTTHGPIVSPADSGGPGDDTEGPSPGPGEEVLRAARYQFLRETAENLGARFVAVAHTSDDQVETVLQRILRGTGFDGLAGMATSRPLSPCVALVRPLLAVSRAAVLEYLRKIGQDFRIDDSNNDTRWTRNRVRRELLPVLRDRYNPAVDAALLRLAAHAAELRQVVAHLSDELALGCVLVRQPPGGTGDDSAIEVRIDRGRLANVPPLVVREMCRRAWRQANWPLQAMGHREWQQLAELVQGQREVPLNLPGNVRAHREDDTVVLTTACATECTVAGAI